jgi:hypothetical protein
MPTNASFELAAAALKEQYQNRIKTVENIIAGHGSLDYPGTRRATIPSLHVHCFEPPTLLSAYTSQFVEAAISETSSCHYQMYMQLGAIGPSVRSSALKDLERGEEPNTTV